MNQLSPLSNFPKISVNRGSALVNGQMTTTPALSVEGGRGPRGRSGDVGDLLSRIAALEARLDAANVVAACDGGTVTVTLNI